MINSARERILSALRSGLEGDQPHPEVIPAVTPAHRSLDARIGLLKTNLEAVRSEVYVTEKVDWHRLLRNIVMDKALKNILVPARTEFRTELERRWNDRNRDLPELLTYKNDIEQFKQQLFEVDASLTLCKAAIADIGALILWPDEHEPRLMSLVPPIHIAVLKASAIRDAFSEILLDRDWTEQMPANALFISGPSKTADIELELAFGVHGPKEVVVIILSDC